MDYAQYKKLKEDIEQEYRKQLEALELLWSRYRRNNASSTSEGSVVGLRETKKFPNAMRMVIDGLTSEFTADDIQEGLNDVLGKSGFNRLQITNTLHRLYRRGEIEVVKKGRGRSPGRYRRKVALKAQVA